MKVGRVLILLAVGLLVFGCATLPLEKEIGKITGVHLLKVQVYGPDTVANPDYTPTARMTLTQKVNTSSGGKTSTTSKSTTVKMEEAGGKPRQATYAFDITGAKRALAETVEQIVRDAAGDLFASKSETESLKGYADIKRVLESDLPVSKATFLGMQLGNVVDIEKVFATDPVAAFLKANPRQAFVIAVVQIAPAVESDDYTKEFKNEYKTGSDSWEFRVSVARPEFHVTLSPVLQMRYAGSKSDLSKAYGFQKGPVLKTEEVRIPFTETVTPSLTVSSWGSATTIGKYAVYGGEYDTQIDLKMASDEIVTAGEAVGASVGSGLGDFVRATREGK